MTMTDEITGTTVLRQALAARNRKINLATMARDLGLPSSVLEAFMTGRALLPANTLQALANIIFEGRAEFDPAIDRLRSANRSEPRSLGVKPEPYQPPPLDYQTGIPTLYPPSAAPPKPAKRPGWA